MNLTPNFTLEELTFSAQAERLQIDNTPTDLIRANLLLCAQGLEKVRALLGSPIHIDSGYRCYALNKAVNGATHSAHLQGYAADFLCRGYGTPAAIVQTIAGSAIQFDKLIMEGSWVHISFDPLARRQLMTAHFSANGTTYTPGI